MTPRRSSRTAAITACAFAAAWTGPVAADVVIAINGAPDQLEPNIRAFLSLSRYTTRSDLDDETMARLERRIVPETEKALEPLGFYEPKVEYDVQHEGTRWTVTINVDPGRPVRLSDVDIVVDGPGKDDPRLEDIIERKELKPGLRLNHGIYDKVKADLLRTALNEGYFDAKYTAADLGIDRKERRATATLTLETGQRYHFGKITTVQNAINDKAMRKLLRMHEGDPYSADALLRSQYVLDDSQYFSTVEIEPGERNLDDLEVPLTITARRNRRNRYAFGLGYATDTQARGKLTWDDRIVNSDGHRFRLELLASSVVTQASFYYVVPVMDIALEKLEFTPSYKEELAADTFSRSSSFTTGLTQVLGEWQRVLFVRVAREYSRVDEVVTDANTGLETTVQTRTTDFLVSPGISFSTLPAYALGGKPKNYSIFAELTGSSTTLGADTSYLRLHLQAERVMRLSPKWELRLRGELGLSRVGNFSELPTSQRFFAGGDRSVRGFALNELSPIEKGKRVGARNLVVGSTEIERHLSGKLHSFGIATFVDVGNAINHFSDPLEYSTGIGVRYNIQVASVGVDVAQALSESGRSPRLHLYISTVF